MQLTFTPDLCSIFLKDETTYYRLQQIIDKHFPHRVGRKDKIILFPKEDELHQRRYFLKLISKLYQKNQNQKKDEVAKLEGSLNKILKFSLLQSGALMPHLNIKLLFENDGAILFKLESNNRLLISYLKNYFKDHLIQYRLKTHTLTLFPNSYDTFKQLEKLVGNSKHLGWIINFHFKKEDLSLLEKRLKNKNGRKRRLNSLYGLLEEYFALLGCSAKDSFEKIRKQYLALVKQYHPDMNSYRSKELTSLYREKFENIQIAYEMIKTYYNEQGSICA